MAQNERPRAHEPTHGGSPKRRRVTPIDQFCGAAQFRWAGPGYVYREDGIGAPIAVTGAERDGFVRDARQMFWAHAAAFIGGLVAIWALVQRFVVGDIPGAAAAAVLGSLLAIGLFASFQRTVASPSRALAGRPVLDVPDERYPVTRPSYGLIALGTVAMLVWVGFQAQRSVALSVIIGVVTVMLAPMLAIRTWRFNRRLSPAQHQRVKAIQAAAQAEARRKRDIPGALLMLVFLVVELALMAGAFYGTLTLTLAAFGASEIDPEGWIFALGFVLGLVAAIAVAWPVDKLCKRLTGISVLEGFHELLSI